MAGRSPRRSVIQPPQNTVSSEADKGTQGSSTGSQKLPEMESHNFSGNLLQYLTAFVVKKIFQLTQGPVII